MLDTLSFIVLALTAVIAYFKWRSAIDVHNMQAILGNDPQHHPAVAQLLEKLDFTGSTEPYDLDQIDKAVRATRATESDLLYFLNFHEALALGLLDGTYGRPVWKAREAMIRACWRRFHLYIKALRKNHPHADYPYYTSIERFCVRRAWRQR